MAYKMDIADSAFSYTLALMAKAYFMAFWPDVRPPPKGYFSSEYFINSCSLETIVFTGFPCCSSSSERHQDAKSCSLTRAPKEVFYKRKCSLNLVQWLQYISDTPQRHQMDYGCDGGRLCYDFILRKRVYQ